MIKYFSIKLFSLESRSRELLQDWKVTEHTGKYLTNYIKYFKTVKLNRDGRREES